jgi:hypothetical protein
MGRGAHADAGGGGGGGERMDMLHVHRGTLINVRIRASDLTLL